MRVTKETVSWLPLLASRLTIQQTLGLHVLITLGLQSSYLDHLPRTSHERSGQELTFSPASCDPRTYKRRRLYVRGSQLAGLDTPLKRQPLIA